MRTATPTGAVAIGPMPTVSAASKIMANGALIVAPGTADQQAGQCQPDRQIWHECVRGETGGAADEEGRHDRAADESGRHARGHRGDLPEDHGDEESRAQGIGLRDRFGQLILAGCQGQRQEDGDDSEHRAAHGRDDDRVHAECGDERRQASDRHGQQPGEHGADESEADGHGEVPGLGAVRRGP